jgi:hypothetical protein
VSFGLGLGAVGSLTTDDYTMIAGASGGPARTGPSATPRRARSGHN